jgi:hypothetical protein
MLSARQLYRSNNQPADYAAPTQFAPEPFQGAAALWQGFHHRRAALSVASMLAS